MFDPTSGRNDLEAYRSAKAVDESWLKKGLGEEEDDLGFILSLLVERAGRKHAS